MLRWQAAHTPIENQGTVLTHQNFLLEGTLHFNEIFQTYFRLQSFLHFPILADSSTNEKLFSPLEFFAFGDMYFTQSLHVSVGRIPYETSFSSVLSSNEREPYPYVFDGVFASYDTNLISVDLFGASVPQPWKGVELVEGLKYGAGVFLDISSVSEFLNSVNLHLVYLFDSLLDNSLPRKTRYGVSIQGNIQHFYYTFSGVAHGEGFKFKSEQYMTHVELSYYQLGLYESRFFGGYHSDTQKYEPWLYDRRAYGGLMNLFGWGNSTYFFLGYKALLPDIFDVEIAFYNLGSTDQGKVHLGWYGALIQDNTNLLGVDVQSKTLLGREVDVKLTKKFNDNFQVDALVGYFFPGEELNEFFHNNDYHQFFQLTGAYQF